jgi:hypothetical protein
MTKPGECVICNNPTQPYKEKSKVFRKTCSKECDSKLRSINSSKKAKNSPWKGMLSKK